MPRQRTTARLAIPDAPQTYCAKRKKAPDDAVAVSVLLPHAAGKSRADKRIDAYYRKQRADLAKLAKQAARYADDGPTPHTLRASATATYHDDQLASSFTDLHYSNNAYHTETRNGDTWHLKTGRQLPLKTLFKWHTPVKRTLVNAALDSLKPTDANRSAVKRSLKTALSPKRYYLTPTALILITKNNKTLPVAYEHLPRWAHSMSVKE